MNTKPVSVSVRSPRKSPRFSSASARAKLRPASANGRGVYETPDFELPRPHKAAGQIEFTVRANRVEAGQWVAEASRMQGMPEWATHHPVATHALRHAGNAVAVPLARELGRQLAAHLVRRT